MEALERAQRVDSNIQGGGVQIFQVGMSVCEGPYGYQGGGGTALCQYQMDLKGGMQHSTNANFPINIDRHSTFFEVVKATNEARIWYKPQAYHIMHKNLLNDAR